MSSEHRREPLHALAIFLGSLALLTATCGDIGLTWDEPDYMIAGQSYLAWFDALAEDPSQALRSAAISAYWSPNHEHPPIDKLWSAICWRASRGVLPDLVARRFGNLLLASAGFALLFALVSGVYGRAVGWASVAALLALPRFFFHAHLAALDVPAVVMVVAVSFVFWKFRNSTSYWTDVSLGALFGLAVATKANAALLFFALSLWVLLFDRRARMGLRLLVMGGLATPLFFAFWPWLYPDPVGRTVAFIRFMTVDHWQIGQWYLGAYYLPPPWHFPYVMTAAVVPTLTLLLFFAGATRVLARGRERAFGGYLLLLLFVPMLVVAAGPTLVYDNDRFFLTSMPFLAALSAVGGEALFSALRRALRERVRAGVLAAVLAAIALAPALLGAASVYPHLLSYYAYGVGGLAGAASLDFEPTYWAESYSEALGYLNEHARPGDTVWVAPSSHNVLKYYQQQGRLRDDIAVTSPGGAPGVFASVPTSARSIARADFALLQNNQSFFGPRGRKSPLALWLESRQPVFTYTLDGVAILWIYRN